LKEKIKELEDKHVSDKKESQKQFEDYKLSVKDKEQ